MEKIKDIDGKERVWVREKLGIWNTLGEAMLFVKDNFKILFLISLAGVALPALLNLLPVKEVPLLGIIYFIGALAGIFTGFWANVALVIAMGNVYDGKKADLAGSFNVALTKLWPFVVNYLIFALLLAAGTLAFIIPGIYISVIYSFISIAVLVEDDRKVSPFKMSAALVKGYFWDVVVYGVAVSLTMIPLMLAGFAVMLPVMGNVSAVMDNPALWLPYYGLQALFTPYFYAVNYILYMKLKEMKKDSPELSDPEKLQPKFNGCLALLGLLFLIIFIIIFMFIVLRVPK